MSNFKRIYQSQQQLFLDEVYSKMTPQEISNAIQIAVKKAREEDFKRYNENLKKISEQVADENYNIMKTTIDTITVELLYELAEQMDYFKLKDIKEKSEDEQYALDSIKVKLQEIFGNTMDHIKKYGTYKSDKQANKNFQKKKKIIEKEFKIEF